MEMYYVREYTPTCRFLKKINSTFTGLVDYFKKSTVFSIMLIMDECIVA